MPRCYTSHTTWPGAQSIERSVALHTAVAERIRHDPEIVSRARRRVREWLRDGSVARVYAEAWAVPLEGPEGELTRALTARGERFDDLRQVSPFAGVLDAKERWRILKALESEQKP